MQPFARQHAQNVLLDAEVVRHHVQALSRFCVLDERWRQERIVALESRIGRIEVVAGLGRNHPGQIGAVHLADVSGSLDQSFRIRQCGRDHAAHHAVVAQVPHQGARIDLGKHRHRKRSMYSSVTCSERQLELMAENSRTIRPSI